VEESLEPARRSFEMTVTVSAFYKFVEIERPAGLRAALFEACESRRILGSILVAAEGVNGTVSGQERDLADFFGWLRTDPRFADLETKDSHAKEHPFGLLKVKLKREIVTFGSPEAKPSEQVGTYVAPKDWNALIEAPDVLVIDTRNAYEVKIGTFKGALDPKTKSFRQFPEFVRQNLDPARHPKVALFCTGGIRCEKASSFLLAQGFPEVYHLEGGILKYLETVPQEESLWQGECFVFDERVSLAHGLGLGSHAMCPSCGSPVHKAANGPSGLCEACAAGERA
jgi:UPF0176 protein